MLAKSQGRLKATEPAAHGRAKHATGVPLACSLCAGQSRSGVNTPRGGLSLRLPPFRKGLRRTGGERMKKNWLAEWRLMMCENMIMDSENRCYTPDGPIKECIDCRYFHREEIEWI